MVALKSSLSTSLKLTSTDVMVLINESWGPSFGNKNTNKNAIANHGWFPFNRMLLNNDETKATMTDIERTEREAKSWRMKPINDTNKNLHVSQMPTMCKDFTAPKINNTPKLNFAGGFSAVCFKRITQHSDVHQARERILKRKNEGSSIKEGLSKEQKLTAGNLVNASANRLGKDTLELMIERLREK